MIKSILFKKIKIKIEKKNVKIASKVKTTKHAPLMHRYELSSNKIQCIDKMINSCKIDETQGVTCFVILQIQGLIVNLRKMRGLL